MYPLLFSPIYKEMIWGGQKLHNCYGRDIPYERTGESWDISYRENDMGRVVNGEFAGMLFSDVVGDLGTEKRRKWLGHKFVNAEFPLFVKTIDANDDLSVQVHPNDAQAQSISGESQGKNEMWYVLDAPENGSLIVGLKNGVTKDEFAEAVYRGNGQAIESLLNRLPIKRGDVIYIPAGLVHALTKGVMVSEIQQNSNITYRVYDYGRIDQDGNPRQLHRNEAIAVIDFEDRHKKFSVPGVKTKDTPFTYYIKSRDFYVIGYDLKEKYVEKSDSDRFFIFTCVEGSCLIHSNKHLTTLTASNSVLIPAALGEYTIETKGCKLLKSFVPDMDKDSIS